MTSAFRGSRWLVAAALLGLPALAGAQGTATVSVDDVECLPIGENNVAWATARNLEPGTTLRLYFRRLNDVVEDFYYGEMNPDGRDRYWGVFPKAEDRPFDRHDLIRQREELAQSYREAYGGEPDRHSWAAWWRVKEASDDRNPNADLDPTLIMERASEGRREPRHWLMEMDDARFQQWLEQLENEPNEYFVAAIGPGGERLGRSLTKVVEVREDCAPILTPQQLGEANNLTVGETANWQRNEELFHWQCDGIVSRVDPFGILRGDDFCRACVVAWNAQPGLLAPNPAAGLAPGGQIIDGDEEPPASPTTPTPPTNPTP